MAFCHLYILLPQAVSNFHNLYHLLRVPRIDYNVRASFVVIAIAGIAVLTQDIFIDSDVLRWKHLLQFLERLLDSCLAAAVAL